MLLLSSRGLTMLRICLWMLVASSTHLACPYAFNILTRNAAASSSLSFPFYSSNLEFSSPSKRRSHFRKFLSKSPISTNSRRSSKSSSMGKSLINPELSTTLYNKPIDLDSSKLFSHFRPKISPFLDDSITSNNDFLKIGHPNEPWRTDIDILGRADLQRDTYPSENFKTLEDEYGREERVKLLKDALRRRLKEKNLRRKLKMHDLNNYRLNKMAEVEKMALIKSPYNTKKSRSVKSRRADYYVHKQPLQQRKPTFTGSFSRLGEGGFLTNDKPQLFKALDMDKGNVMVPGNAGGFFPQPQPANTQIDFILDDNDQFGSMLASSPSSLSSSLSSSPSTSAHRRFPQYQSGHKHNSFGSFIDFQPPSRQPSTSLQKDSGFGFFPHSSTQSDAASDVDSDGALPSSALGFSNGGSFVGSFGGFQNDDRDCETISTKVCHSSKDCSCNGFYACFGSRCILKQGSSQQTGDAHPIGGVWSDSPVILPVNGHSSFHDYKPMK